MVKVCRARVGDLFKVVTSDYTGNFDIGEIVEVVCIGQDYEDDFPHVDVRCSNGSIRYGWILWNGDFEPVKPVRITKREAVRAKGLPSPEEAFNFVMRRKP